MMYSTITRNLTIKRIQELATLDAEQHNLDNVLSDAQHAYLQHNDNFSITSNLFINTYDAIIYESHLMVSIALYKNYEKSNLNSELNKVKLKKKLNDLLLQNRKIDYVLDRINMFKSISNKYFY